MINYPVQRVLATIVILTELVPATAWSRAGEMAHRDRVSANSLAFVLLDGWFHESGMNNLGESGQLFENHKSCLSSGELDMLRNQIVGRFQDRRFPCQ